MLTVFLSGGFVGGTLVFFSLMRVVERASVIWDLNVSQTEIHTRLRALSALDRGRTNDFERFRSDSFFAFSNYLQKVENLRKDDPIRELFYPSYKDVKNYLNSESVSNSTQLP